MTSTAGTTSRPQKVPALCVGTPAVGEGGLVRRYADIPDYIARLEQAGAALVTLPDRLLMTEDMGHPGGGQYPRSTSTPYLEPLVILGAIAIRTEKIILSTSVLLAPLRYPVVLAKAAATVDVLSDGRLELGLGAGWFATEFEANGAKVEERFERLDDAIQICRALWAGPPATFHGRWSSFTDVTQRPIPVNGTIPIWIGTQARPSAKTAERIAKWADGWLFSSRSTFDDVTYGIELLNDACAKVGRDPNTIPIRAQIRTALQSAGKDGKPDLDAEIEEMAGIVMNYGAAGIDFVSAGYGSAADADEIVHFIGGLHTRLNQSK